MKETPPTERIQIDRIADTGEGIGTDETGKVTFVPYALPGEVAEVIIREEKKDFRRGEIARLLTPSPHRIEPKCPLFTKCGGCDWQHLPYKKQLELKEKIFIDKFYQITGKSLAKGEFQVFGVEREFQNRWRLRLQVTRDKRLAFFAYRSKKLIPISHCPIASEPLQKSFSPLERFLRSLPLPAREVKLISTPCGEVSAAVYLRGKKKTNPIKLLNSSQFKNSWRKLRENSPVVGLELFIDGEWFGNFGTTELKVGEPYHYVTASGFAQANWEANALLIEWLYKAVSSEEITHIIEVYGGSGNLAMAVSPAVKEIFSGDIDPKGVQLGSRAAREQQLSHCVFFQFDARRDELSSVLPNEKLPLLRTLMADPPRGGLSKKLLQQIEELKFSHFIYISCDVNSFTRDIRTLEGMGYKVKKLALFDFMPQTAHLEMASVLSSV